MKVTVKYYAKFREFTGNIQDEFEFDKITLHEIIEKIVEIYPKIGKEHNLNDIEINELKEDYNLWEDPIWQYL